MADKQLHVTYGEKTINELSLLFGKRQINLQPGFQRQSVWSGTDRSRLIQSIMVSYPLPSIFLYRRESNGRIVYDVIDGKQRLETIYMFTRQGRFKSQGFDVRLDLGDGPYWYDWLGVKKWHPGQRATFESYRLPVVEVAGELNQIIDLFVRINSTGKRLTSGEKRHAKFYTSVFLKEANVLVQRYRKYLVKNRILANSQIDRMKGTELFAELLMSIHQGGPINKKTSLDRAIGNDGVHGQTLNKIVKEFKWTMGAIGKMFPDLAKIRMHNSAEFYSLFLLVWEMQREKFALSEAKRSRMAFEVLRTLSNGVDELRDQLRRAQPAKPAQRLFADYLLTVQGDTDSSANRERRRQLLKGLLWSLFDRTDSRRIFSSEQRRLLWNRDDRQNCARCGNPVTWQEFTVDHVKAWSKGGSTSMPNAKIMHRHCNSSKGNR